MKTFTQTEDFDLDASERALLETFRRNEGSSLKTLIGIYKGHYHYCGSTTTLNDCSYYCTNCNRYNWILSYFFKYLF